MTAKEYCRTTKPYAVNTRGNCECIGIHGIEHGVHDMAFVSHVIGDTIKYHKVRINYSADRAYIVVQEMRIYLDDFVKVDI